MGVPDEENIFMPNMLKMTRFASFPDRTLGELRFETRVWYTIERPWLDNKPSVSCIPPGYFTMVRANSPRFSTDPAYQGKLWEISTVQQRTHILLHVANYSRDLAGCVGLGTGLMGDLAGVSHSRTACTDFYSLTAGLDLLEIQIQYGALRPEGQV